MGALISTRKHRRHSKFSFCATWCAKTDSLYILKQHLISHRMWLTWGERNYIEEYRHVRRTTRCLRNRPVVEEATRGGWRSWKLPPKGAPCAGLDLNPRRQPVLARGRAPRRARPGAERAPVAARDLVAGERGLSAQGRVRAGQRRPPAAAPGHQPCRNWRIACGNCGNPSQASNDGQRFAPRPDWRIACGNCGNSFAGARSGDQRFAH